VSAVRTLHGTTNAGGTISGGSGGSRSGTGTGSGPTYIVTPLPGGGWVEWYDDGHSWWYREYDAGGNLIHAEIGEFRSASPTGNGLLAYQAAHAGQASSAYQAAPKPQGAMASVQFLADVSGGLEGGLTDQQIDEIKETLGYVMSKPKDDYERAWLLNADRAILSAMANRQDNSFLGSVWGAGNSLWNAFLGDSFATLILRREERLRIARELRSGGDFTIDVELHKASRAQSRSDTQVVVNLIEVTLLGAQGLRVARLATTPYTMVEAGAAESFRLSIPQSAVRSGALRSADDIYGGVRQASKYLQEAGVPRPARVSILQAFEEETISFRYAGPSDHGIRFYSDPKYPAGQWLFDTFPASRETLAIKPEWNDMIGFRQFRIRPGTPIIDGRAAGQGPYLPGGQMQRFILDWRSGLIDP
jgi:hypothetical protein